MRSITAKLERLEARAPRPATADNRIMSLIVSDAEALAVCEAVRVAFPDRKPTTQELAAFPGVAETVERLMAKDKAMLLEPPERPL